MLNTQYSLVTLLDEADLNNPASSSAYNIKNLIGYAVQHSWASGSSDRVATLELEASNEEDGPYTIVDTFTIDGNDGTRLINVEFPRYNFIKITTSVDNAGGGTLTSTISGRSL